MDDSEHQNNIRVPVEKKNTESAMKHARANVRYDVALLNRGGEGVGGGGVKQARLRNYNCQIVKTAKSSHPRQSAHNYDDNAKKC